jgi:hypothetical protein
MHAVQTPSGSTHSVANGKTPGERIKLVLDILQSVLTIGAICAGAWWFFKQESIKPQIKIDQTISQRALNGESSEVLITVDVRATNIGKTKVELPVGKMEVAQINPIPGYKIDEYPLRTLLLEPGESDQALFQAIRLDKSTLTIQVRSEYPVPGSNNAWSLLSAVDIGDGGTKKESASSVH